MSAYQFECPYCGSELDIVDTFSKYDYKQHKYIVTHYIYKCPNSDGFETKEEALKYQPEELEVINDITNIKDIDWQDIVCESSTHHVSGSFYTYYKEDGYLYNGYPF